MAINTNVTSGLGIQSSSGLMAERPVDAKAGDEYWPTDSSYKYRHNGTIWEAWGPIRKVIPPPSTLSWFNQTNGTVDYSSGALYLSQPGQTSDSLQILEMNAPSSPYTITMGFAFAFNFSNFAWCGIALRDSSSGKLLTPNVTFQNECFLGITQWNSVTSYNTDFGPVTNTTAFSNLPVYLQLQNDGVNYTTSYSFDGFHWTTHSSIGRTAFLASPASKIGVLVNSRNNKPINMNVFHWTVATP